VAEEQKPVVEAKGDSAAPDGAAVEYFKAEIKRIATERDALKSRLKEVEPLAAEAPAAKQELESLRGQAGASAAKLKARDEHLEAEAKAIADALPEALRGLVPSSVDVVERIAKLRALASALEQQKPKVPPLAGASDRQSEASTVDAFIRNPSELRNAGKKKILDVVKRLGGNRLLYGG
jgi:peptidoglycan hydrolase CwlO-like protein